MNRDEQKIPRQINESTKSKNQWESPQVWDILIGNTEGGAEPAPFEIVSGTYATPELKPSRAPS